MESDLSLSLQTAGERQSRRPEDGRTARHRRWGGALPYQCRAKV